MSDMSRINEVFITRLKQVVDKSKKICITGHVGPDGDSLGSMLALYKGLKQVHDNVIALAIDKVPDYLNFMPFLDELTDIKKVDETDTIILVDVASLDRIGDAVNLFEKARMRIVIDHHASNKGFSDLNLIKPHASSTCEIIYDLIRDLELKITPSIASLLYTGILTDTNRFLYESTDYNTLNAASNLLKLGANKDLIHYKLYQTGTMSSFKLNEKLVKETEFHKKNKIAYVYLSNQILEEIGANEEDVEDKINMIRDIVDVELSILVKDRDGNLKISMRSKNHIDTSKIAIELGGGGHKRSAGFSYHGSESDLKKDLWEILNKIDWDNI